MRHAELVSASIMDPPNIIKTYTSKKRNEVVFRYPTWEDLDDMLAFANGLISEDTFVALSGDSITKEKEEEFLKKMLDEIANKRKIYLVVTVKGHYAGSGEIRMHDMRKKHVGEIGIALDKEYREEGIGTELLQTLIDLAKQAKLSLLTLNCFENNTRACHVYEKLGFIKAGVIPKAVHFKDEYIGEVHFYLPLL